MVGGVGLVPVTTGSQEEGEEEEEEEEAAEAAAAATTTTIHREEGEGRIGGTDPECPWTGAKNRLNWN